MIEGDLVDVLRDFVERGRLTFEKDQKLKELKKTDSWKRGSYVEKQGWATMPSEKKPDSKVAAECSSQILEV